MKGRGRSLLLLGGAGFFSPSYSLRIFRLAVSEPSPGLPQFLTVGSVDDQPIIRYDSHSRRMWPLAPWMRKVEQDEPRFWEEESLILRGDETLYRETLTVLQDLFHHHSSTGLHTLQLMISCEVWPDGRPGGGRHQYAYDGEAFIVLDKETPAWTVLVPQAEIVKQKLGSLLAHPQHAKAYLEGTCVDWLKKYLEYGNETLLRTGEGSPQQGGWHARKTDGWETLICQVYGFYPKEIEVTWMKDGEDRKPDTITGGVLPNSDGTYHTWLSIDVDPKERDHYRCRVEHDSLPEPLELMWKKPGYNLELLRGIFGTALAASIVLGILVLPRSDSGLLQGFFGSLLVASLLLGVFLFLTSHSGFLVGTILCGVVATFLLGTAFIQTSNFWLLPGNVVFGFASGIPFLMLVSPTSNVEFFLCIIECVLVAPILLQFILLLKDRGRRRKRKKEEP